jgi:hypothetical protein
MNYLLRMRRDHSAAELPVSLEVDSLVRTVFGPFQNLNLLALLADLRAGDTVLGNWASGHLLCPVAHGMPVGQVVADLCYLSQARGLKGACDYAARHLGGDPVSIERFVERWDDRVTGPTWLLGQLELLWAERRTDADAIQEVLAPLGDQEESMDSPILAFRR